MALSLIEKLNSLSNKTPDEIANNLRDPFSKWRLGKYMTREEFDNNRDLPIVLLSFNRWNSPDRAEVHNHTVGKWSWREHWRDWIGTDYYMRSLESYNANPSECVDREAEYCRRG